MQGGNGFEGGERGEHVAPRREGSNEAPPDLCRVLQISACQTERGGGTEKSLPRIAIQIGAGTHLGKQLRIQIAAEGAFARIGCTDHHDQAVQLIRAQRFPGGGDIEGVGQFTGLRAVQGPALTLPPPPHAGFDRVHPWSPPPENL